MEDAVLPCAACLLGDSSEASSCRLQQSTSQWSSAAKDRDCEEAFKRAVESGWTPLGAVGVGSGSGSSLWRGETTPSGRYRRTREQCGSVAPDRLIWALSLDSGLSMSP